MADQRFSLIVLSAEKQLFSGVVRSLTVPTEDGELTILPQHSTLVSNLHAGELVFVDEAGQREHLFVAGGVLEVAPDGTARVLADTAERADDIDEKAAAEARTRAEESLSQAVAEPEVIAARAALYQAIARLRVAERRRRK